MLSRADRIGRRLLLHPTPCVYTPNCVKALDSFLPFLSLSFHPTKFFVSRTPSHTLEIKTHEDVEASSTTSAPPKIVGPSGNGMGQLLALLLLADRLNPALSAAEPVSVLARDLFLLSNLITLYRHALNAQLSNFSDLQADLKLIAS